MIEFNNIMQDLRDAIAASSEAELKFNARCNDLVNTAREYMKLAKITDDLVIGDTRQGVCIPSNGRIHWYGIVTSAILDGYEESLKAMIVNETDRIKTNIERYL